MLGMIVFAVAFLPRLFHLLSIQASPLFNYLAPDPLSYYQLASKLAAGQTVGDAILFRAPLYPYLLALYYWVFGQALFMPLLLQSILGAFACVMVYIIARRYYANKIAITAGLATALCGPLIFFGGELLPFTLALTLNLIAIWLLTDYEESRKPSQLFTAGLLLGLSAAAHPAILLLAPIVVLWIYQRLSQNRQEWIKQTMPFVIGILIVLVPVAAHNVIAGGETVVFETYGGVNFGAGNNTQADGGKPVLPGTLSDAQPSIDVASALASQQTGRKLTATETGSYWLGQGFKYIFTQPLSWIGLQMRKVAYLITGYEIPKDRQVYFFAKQSSLLRYLLWEKLIAFPFGILLPLALPALAAGSPLRRSKRQCVLTGYVLSYVLIMLLFTVTSRYRAMLVPITTIWSAAGFWTLVQLYREGSYSKFYRWLAVLVAALVVCNGIAYIPGLSPRVHADFEGFMFTGSAYYSTGKYADAEQNFYNAAMLNPRSAAVFTNLGNACARRNKDSSAVDYYRRAMAVDPNDDRPKKAAAEIYRKRDRIKDLADLAVAEIKKNPKAVWAYHEYAYVHVKLEEYPTAANLYEQAFEADTTDYSAIFLKAGCYLAADMRMEAAEQYQRFLKYVPNSVEAHANLGQVYARQNRLEQALEQFQRVVNMQPDNPAGYFNLASTYLQMGDFNKADESLNKTVSLDPKFPGITDVRQMIVNERAGKK
ncbi:MAG: tetratricopeptide repeat protein [candidate division Zixibacteria bacterium]|nr:tetratricopeptide repeat protein [candidate division Zixibacteria bacterium]